MVTLLAFLFALSTFAFETVIFFAAGFGVGVVVAVGFGFPALVGAGV